MKIQSKLDPTTEVTVSDEGDDFVVITTSYKRGNMKRSRVDESIAIPRDAVGKLAEYLRGLVKLP